jgi:hypothetical protein
MKQPLSNNYKHTHVRELIFEDKSGCRVLRFGDSETKDIQLNIIINFIS